MVKNLASTTGGVSSIPAWETEIPHAVKYGPPPKKGQKISTVEEIWEPSCTAGQNVNWYNHYAKQYSGSSKNEKYKLPYNPAILLLNTSPKKQKH